MFFPACCWLLVLAAACCCLLLLLQRLLLLVLAAACCCLLLLLQKLLLLLLLVPGWENTMAALKAHRKPLLWPGPGVPVGEVALALGCMLGKVFGILEVWILCRLANGSFEAHRKSLLWI